MIAIFILSSISGHSLDHYMLHVKMWDKICHTIAFATGAAILGWALRQTTSLSALAIFLLTIAIISLYGATDEWHQKFTPGRSACDLWDWLADTTGATLAAFATYVRHRAKTSTGADLAVAAGD